MCTLLRTAALVAVLAALAPVSTIDVAGLEKTADDLTVEVGGGRLRLAVCSERAIRVLFTPQVGPEEEVHAADRLAA